jgi:hypothetical protein
VYDQAADGAPGFPLFEKFMLSVPNGVVVDCTASPYPASMYVFLLCEILCFYYFQFLVRLDFIFPSSLKNNLNMFSSNHSRIEHKSPNFCRFARYANWLNSGLHVVTPNKKAGSGDLAYYQQVC